MLSNLGDRDIEPGSAWASVDTGLIERKLPPIVLRNLPKGASDTICFCAGVDIYDSTGAKVAALVWDPDAEGVRVWLEIYGDATARKAHR